MIDEKREIKTLNNGTFNTKGNDEVKLTKKEAIELCKMFEGAKRILQSKIKETA